MFECALRPLTQKEVGRLEQQLQSRRADLKQVVPRTAFVGSIIISVLCIATIVASPVPWWFIVAFWTAIGVVLFVWVAFPEYSRVKGDVRSLEEALGRNEAEVYRVQADSFIEFEENEDLGACYAIQVGAEDIVFITGQDFYSTRSFPSTDFSVVNIYDSHNGIVDLQIEALGQKLKPVRKIGTGIQANLRVPEHFERIDGRLEELESLLQVKGRSV
jgi:hypothetical protein